jgi:hypothetical protein
MVADHIGLLWLYLYPDNVRWLTVIDTRTVILLALYSVVVVVVAYVITGTVSDSKYSAVRIPDINLKIG